jgi:hypothetical protein
MKDITSISTYSRHPREGGDPSKTMRSVSAPLRSYFIYTEGALKYFKSLCDTFLRWIPAFARMTRES